MDTGKNSNTEIAGVSDYLNRVKELIDLKDEKSLIFLYRGETDASYDKPCEPNIFRKNILSSNRLYEKSLFNAMRQHKLSNSMSYLENAIDAQHGEFPSRLLDVSYNCLDALYFAVTPYYHKQPSQYDDRDGAVYVFYIDEIFSPSAQNTNDNYNAIINKDLKWFTDNIIFAKNHKFIDHTKLNNRIVAQQGAFILFQGHDAESIPPYMMNKIIIPKEAKKALRRELSLMFGINTGSIYPEIVNLANDLSEKSRMLVTQEFNWENEIKYVLSNLRKELIYYTEQLFFLKTQTQRIAYFQLVQKIEVVINSYRIGFIEFVQSFEENDLRKDSKNTCDEIIDNYNNLVREFIVEVKKLCGIDISPDLYIPIIQKDGKNDE